MIGFDGNTQESVDFKFITVNGIEDAIQENIFFEDFIVEAIEGKDAFLEVIVRNARNQTCKQRYYAPVIDGTIIKDETDLKKNTDKFIKITKNIATKVLGENAAMSGKTWFELWTNMVKAIKAKANWNNIAMRAVFVHKEGKDNKVYTVIRSYSPMFELMSTTPSKLSLNTTYDKFIVKSPSSESSVNNAVSNPTTAADIF